MNEAEYVRLVRAEAELTAKVAELAASLRFYVSICGNTAHSVSRESAQEAYALAQKALAKAVA